VIPLRHLYVCNTTCDSIDKINIEDFTIESIIPLNGVGGGKIGPHGIWLQDNFLFTSNCYDNSISIVDLKNGMVESIYLGSNCRDICVLGNHAYIICGDSNNIVSFDINSKEIIELIPCGNSPHSIDCCNINSEIVVANTNSDSITLFDALYGSNIYNIDVGPYPTKAVITLDGDYILVCESNMGYSDKGCISMISTKTHKIIHRIPVGNCPFDMCCDERYCYVSNYGDGSISIIDIANREEINRIRIGGMPRGILSHNKHIFVGDSYNNLLIKIDKETENKKVIPINGEPTGMILS
jgi:YVTN family beta-propeller protein